MSEYIYTDLNGSGLYAGTSSNPGADVYLDADVHILAADLPEVVAGLYRAAGQEPPILLPRYAPEPEMTRDGKVRAEIRPSGQDMTPADALDMASWYATAAEKAAAEALSQPDPEQVEEIVELLYQSGVIDDSEWAADRATKIADVLLRAGYARTEDKA